MKEKERKEQERAREQQKRQMEAKKRNRRTLMINNDKKDGDQKGVMDELIGALKSGEAFGRRKGRGTTRRGAPRASKIVTVDMSPGAGILGAGGDSLLRPKKDGAGPPRRRRQKGAATVKSSLAADMLGDLVASSSAAA
eukprot:UC1_evm1s1502